MSLARTKDLANNAAAKNVKASRCCHDIVGRLSQGGLRLPAGCGDGCELVLGERERSHDLFLLAHHLNPNRWLCRFLGSVPWRGILSRATDYS